MSDALRRALGDSTRSLIAAKAAVSTRFNESLFASGLAGVPTHRPDLAQAQEQLRHFKGWVYTAIRPISQRIAGQPIHVGRTGSTRRIGTKQSADIKPLDDHPLIGLLDDPNELMVAWSLIFVSVASLELTGRQLWWLPEKKQIYPIPTSWIKSFEGTTKFTAFNVQPPYSGEPIPIPADECVLFAYPSPSDPHGAFCPLQAVAGAVDADEAIIVSQAEMFRKGIHPSHALIVGQDTETKLRPRLDA